MIRPPSTSRMSPRLTVVRSSAVRDCPDVCCRCHPPGHKVAICPDSTGAYAPDPTDAKAASPSPGSSRPGTPHAPATTTIPRRRRARRRALRRPTTREKSPCARRPRGDVARASSEPRTRLAAVRAWGTDAHHTGRARPRAGRAVVAGEGLAGTPAEGRLPREGADTRPLLEVGMLAAENESAAADAPRIRTPRPPAHFGTSGTGSGVFRWGASGRHSSAPWSWRSNTLVWDRRGGGVRWL